MLVWFHAGRRQGTAHPPADFRLLPIIDLNPNDRSCINSTLVFVKEQARRLNISVACLTFDQPLGIKAVEIVADDRLNVVCQLQCESKKNPPPTVF